MKPFEIAGREIGPGQPCFVIAEAGVNHNGSLDLAHRLIDVAAAAGADAVKFQTFSADRLVTADAPKADYQRQYTSAVETQAEMLKRLELSPEMHHVLWEHCRASGLLFLSTPFDELSADFLETLGVAAFKVPSGEITNLPFLVHLARKDRPLIVSTGMALLSEVDAAVRTIRTHGDPPLSLLHCVSNYPADPAEANLRAMETLARAFGVPVGFSDHMAGTEVALAAIALGASILERHFTLDRALPGPDHAASLEPRELAALVQGVRTVEAALGHGRKEPAASEQATAVVARKSLVTACPVPAGTILGTAHVTVKRPGSGLPPAMLPYILGRRARHALAAGTVLTLDMLT